MIIRSEKFETKRDGLTIRGTKYLPEREDIREEDLQAVIISHGFTGDQSGTAPYAKLIAATGRCAAYVFDFCGGGFLSSSDGDTREMSALTEVLDLKAVIRHVQEERAQLGSGAEKVSVSNVIGWVSVMFAQWSAARPMEVSVEPYMASPASGAPREAKWTRI